ncbi:hypothetical protein [Vibrio parahaemolyticus]|uniref:hypothetical protein n=1 Tax=Vibrio parahaemolyticus TaxID=670 RepID=UPI0015DEE775|nr:hypothetical protein [Vibrio parahaemolyticus]
MAKSKRIVISFNRKKFVPKGRLIGFGVFLFIAFVYLFSPQVAPNALNGSFNDVKVKP